MRPPFFVVGAPRSGTTYLVEVLDRHPEIMLTNETRVMTFVAKILHEYGKRQFVLLNERDRFLLRLRRELPEVVRRFYEDLGASQDSRWGDKFPHYADPNIDPRGLDLIDEFFPRCQFVHIVRDGRDVAASLLRKGWVDFDEALDVWSRHVTHARDFGLRLGLGRYHELRYDDLIQDGPSTVRRLLAFLDVDPDDPVVRRFLEQQDRERTPFSGATTDATRIGSTTWQQRLRPEQITRANRKLADPLVALGFESHRWREQLVPAVLARD